MLSATFGKFLKMFGTCLEIFGKSLKIFAKSLGSTQKCLSRKIFGEKALCMMTFC